MTQIIIGVVVVVAVLIAAVATGGGVLKKVNVKKMLSNVLKAKPEAAKEAAPESHEMTPTEAQTVV